VIACLQQEGFATAALCEVLEVDRSRCYAWRRGNQSCGVDRVARLLREMGLKAIQPKSYRPRTTDSRHRLGFSPNLLLESPPPDGINQVWVGDISYVPRRAGDFLYLAMLMDLYSRRIVAWELRDHMKESLTLAALREAIALRSPRAGLIHHSDRGGQYAGKAYRRVLARSEICQSMSRADSCYDNAFMESCFGTIKTELETELEMELEMEAYETERASRGYDLDGLGNWKKTNFDPATQLHLKLNEGSGSTNHFAPLAASRHAVNNFRLAASRRRLRFFAAGQALSARFRF